MKTTAHTAVPLVSRVAADRAPNAVWLVVPPKAEAKSPALPDCKSTTNIKMMQAIR
jgi:hypothetical protein